MSKLLYIIIINYNSYLDTIKCIESIKTNEPILQKKIIVIDNKSTNDSVDQLSKINDIILLKNNYNDGFAKGNNIGIKYAMKQHAKYVLLLNNDTEITKNSISIMLDKIKQESTIGIIGSRIMYYNNKELINYCGGHYNWVKGSNVHDNENQKYIHKEKFFYTEFISGCSMLIDTEVFKKVGLLPEEYFMYYEDADFCIKVKEAGFKLGVCTNSIIYHKVGASSDNGKGPFTLKYLTRNRIIFINKYYKYTYKNFTKLYFYITAISKIIIYYFIGKKDNARAIIDGLKMGLNYIKERR